MGYRQEIVWESELATAYRKPFQTSRSTITATPSPDQNLSGSSPFQSTEWAQSAYLPTLFHPFYDVQLHGQRLDIRI